MKRLGFILFIIAVYPLSLLPMRVMYILSDLLYVVLFHIVKYRRQVVHTNLMKAFPEKTESEISQISNAFYKNLCDIFIEALKMITISRKEIQQRNVYDDFSILEKFKSENKSVIAVVGHFSNWEWGGSALSILSPMQVFSAYRPLSNPYFNRFLFRIRGKFGIRLVKMEDIYKTILRQNQPTLSVFIADQTPPNTKATYWTTFLSQDTPIFLGVEKIAARLNTPVVFLYPLRLKRGYYKIYCRLLVEDPSKLTGEHEITELHVKFLEQLIREHPEQWLWSHKRWKHKRIVEPVGEM
jgi:Kdo2-lipid IVA lauroyltransferase/acyltransferase